MGSSVRPGMTSMLLVPLCFSLLANQPVRAVPLEVYGRLPSVEDVALSPDGSKLAFVRTTAELRGLAIVGVANHEFLGGAKLGEIKLRRLWWADDDHLLIETSAAEQAQGLYGPTVEWSHLFVYEVSTQKRTEYPQFLPGTPPLRMMNILFGPVRVRRVNGGTSVFLTGLYFDGGRAKPMLLRVDLATGRESVVRKGDAATREWLVDRDGQIAAESDYDEWDKRWVIRIPRGDRLAGIESGHSAIESPRILGFGPQGDGVLIAALQDGDPVWRVLSLKDGQLGPPLQDWQMMDGAIEGQLTQRLIGGVRFDNGWRYRFFDEDLQSRWDSIADGFADERVQLASVSGDLMKFVVLVDGPVHGYRYELIDMHTAHAVPIGDVYDGLTQPLQVRHFSYSGADGFEVPAYLTLPEGKPATRLPLVVMPHGGPAVRDTGGFDWWAQALASQGYAVLQPNYRGSALNWKFLSAGFGEWGRKMQTDLSDGVRFLAREGTIDPARVCIVGASYGGYAALAGVTLDAGVYRCAVSVAGISDLRVFLNEETDYQHGESRPQRYWDRYLGVASHTDPAVDTLSPVKYVDRVNVPVLLIHGRDDTVVRFRQSELMLNALKAAHKNVKLVELKHEDHWLSRSETRLQMLQSTVDFLRANNPPD